MAQPTKQSHKHSIRTAGNKRKQLTRMAFGTMLVLGLWASSHVMRHGQLPFLRRESVWSIAVYEGQSPFALRPVTPENHPILTAKDVDDVDALFVADPFVVEHENQWFMFIEVLNRATRHGDIGLATSDDGTTWNYDRIILDEAFHLSYPSVFRWQDRWYMVPDCHSVHGVQLYESVEFPHAWRHRKTLVELTDPADPTVFRHGQRWWMFVGTAATHRQLRLFSALDLFGDWDEHPQSPLIVNDPHRARPGGSVVHFGGSPYRLGQDCSPRYGNKLRAYKITSLSPSTYQEKPLADPVLRAGNQRWNSVGMHHSDAHELADGKWRAYVDGHRKTWILRTVP